MHRNIISFVNHKGGAGKTTSAVNIGACLGEMGEKALLVDMDPQGSASISLGCMDDGSALLHALQGTSGLPWRDTGFSGLDLVPSGPALSAGRDRFSGVIGSELLSRCLPRTEGGWMWILLDCPPGLDILTMNALKASRHVVVPVEASFLGLHGIVQIAEIVQALRKAGQDLSIRAIVPCRAHPRRRVHREIMDRVERQFPGLVTPVVRESVSLVEATGKGQPVVRHAPRSAASEDYRRVAAWLVRHLPDLVP